MYSLQTSLQTSFRLLLITIALSPSTLVAQDAPQRIYLAADDHTDYFWTADDVTYRKAFIETLDYYLDLIDRTQDDPPPYQARWNCDGSLWLWEYEKNKSPEEFAGLISRIRSGHISSPSTALASTYGAQPAEAVLRGMYYAGSLERKHDLRFTMGVAMENQTLPLGLGSLWYGAGVRYSWRGVCGCATKMPIAPMRSRDREIYWWTGQDGSRVLMKWNSLFGKNESIGGYSEARFPKQAIEFVRGDKRFQSSYAFQTIGIFGQGWDDLKTLSDEFPRVAREMSNDRQQVIVSNEEDFFRQFEKQYGDALVEESLAFGNEWDLYCTSMAEQTARVRRSVEKLRSAEALATMVARTEPAFWNSFREQREQTHMDLGLYWEHDWTADAQVAMGDKRARWQVKLANQISDYADTLHQRSATRFASLISPDEDTDANGRRFYVFNPLGWERSGVVDLPLEDSAGGGMHVVDTATDQEVAFQIVNIQEKSMLRIFADRIPSVGYHVFEIRDRAGKSFDEAAKPSGRTLENDGLRVVATETGSISSLFDKRLKQELAGSGGLNVLLGDPISDEPGRVVVESVGPVSTTLRIDAPNPLRHSTRITLHRNSDHVEIENVIRQNFQDVRTWEFDFSIQEHAIVHEEIGAILKAQLKGKGGDYSSRNARYDWLTLNHFVDISGKAAGQMSGVTLANTDCCFFQSGNSTPDFLDTKTPTIKVLAGGQVDGSKLGIRRQNGDTVFTQRFALRPHTGECDPVDAMRWSVEWQNPMVARMLVDSADENTSLYPPRQFSLFGCSNDQVLLWALKPAEEGIDAGMIARLWNLDEEPGFATLWGDGIQSAVAATHIETDREPLGTSPEPLVLPFAPRQMRTVRLMTKTESKTSTSSE